MTLISKCHRCWKECTISLPDGMPEGEVARVAAAFVCVECAAKLQAEQARRQEESGSCMTCGSTARPCSVWDLYKRMADESVAEARRVMDRADETLRKLKAKEATKPAAKPASKPPPAVAVTKPAPAKPITPKPGLTVPSWAKISVDTTNNQSKGTNEKPSKKRIYV